MEESKHGDGPIGLWQDPDFPPSKESIGDLNEEEVPDIIWLRPSQFSSKYANKDRPFVLFDGEKYSGDLTLTSEKILDDSFYCGSSFSCSESSFRFYRKSFRERHGRRFRHRSRYRTVLHFGYVDKNSN